MAAINYRWKPGLSGAPGVSAWAAAAAVVNYNAVLSSVDGCHCRARHQAGTTLTWWHNLISSDFTVPCSRQLVNGWPTDRRGSLVRRRWLVITLDRMASSVYHAYAQHIGLRGWPSLPLVSDTFTQLSIEEQLSTTLLCRTFVQYTGWYLLVH